MTPNEAWLAETERLLRIIGIGNYPNKVRYCNFCGMVILENYKDRCTNIKSCDYAKYLDEREKVLLEISNDNS